MLLTNLVVALLALNALFTGLLLGRSNRKISKKRHFQARIEQTERSIWDTEFAKEKYKAIREDVRQQYDRVNENLMVAKQRLEVEEAKSPADAKNIENLKALVEKYSPDIDQLKKQMTALDEQIDNEYNPEACTQKIEASRALCSMLKSHASNL